MLKYLLDENVDPKYKTQMARRNPEICMWVVGEPAAPPRGTLDPEILDWCEMHSFILVTNNRASMPAHLLEHINTGHHVPGIFILAPNLTMGQNIEQLAFIAEASFEDEYQDQIVYLPKI